MKQTGQDVTATGTYRRFFKLEIKQEIKERGGCHLNFVMLIIFEVSKKTFFLLPYFWSDHIRFGVISEQIIPAAGVICQSSGRDKNGCFGHVVVMGSQVIAAFPCHGGIRDYVNLGALCSYTYCVDASG